MAPRQNRSAMLRAAKMNAAPTPSLAVNGKASTIKPKVASKAAPKTVAV